MAQDPCLNLQLLGSESISFTLDNMGRFLCNTLQEALCSTEQTIAGRLRGFDVIIIGGGTFGAVMAEHLFRWLAPGAARLDRPQWTAQDRI